MRNCYFLVAYQFAFEYIAENVTIQPTHLMADAAQSITTAVRSIYPQIIRLTCFFHIKQMFRRNSSFSSLKKMKKEKENAELMLSDFSEIQKYRLLLISNQLSVRGRKNGKRK